MKEIPNVVSVPFRINEPVIEFVRRVLMKAAQEIGLPVGEQQLFANAMLAQYPATAERSWEKDVTPSDQKSKIQTSDFNFLLYRQLLNENSSIRAMARRGKKIQVKELKAVEGRVFSSSSIDELTKIELTRWRQDFIYRGGQLETGLEAPISRTGLVPALQERAGQPDITWIPQIMRSKGWNEGATLMEEWLRRPARIRPTNLDDVLNDFGPPVLNVVTMDWIVSNFKRAESVYNQIINERLWKNDKAKPVIGRMLARTGITAQAQANQERKIKFGDLTSSNVIAIEAVHIQYRPVEQSTWNAYWHSDSLTAAIKDFTLRVAIKGEAKYTQNGIEVTVEEVGIYAKESYDFINDGTVYVYTTDQPLGVWEEGVGYVTNDSFNEWRTANNKGGDFWVYSDIKVTRLNPPDVFIVPL